MDYFPLTMRVCVLVVLIWLLFGCSERESVFSSLALIHIGRDFPHTQEDLTRCRKINDEQCLNNYERAKLAKRKLFSRSREEALNLSLNTIAEQCIGDELSVDCWGALTAIYFFPSHQDDQLIRNYMKTASQVVLHNMVSKGGLWLKNRENKSGWREWITTSPLSAEDQKTFLIFLDMQSDENLTINHLNDPV